MENDMKKLRIGLPSGSLMEATIQLFAKAGFIISGSVRSYRPLVNDSELEIRMLRAQEISRYVEHGYLDCGITGRDWMIENNSEVVEVESLPYSKASSSPTRWVLAVPNDSSICSIHDLEGKRIATEAVGITKSFFNKHNVSAHIEFSWGATEVKAPDLVDAIVEITETGSSLRANNLRIIDTVLESYPVLIANEGAWRDDWRRKKLQCLALLLKGALEARDLVGVKMNLPAANLKNLLEALPSLRNPTVSPLAHTGWVAVETVIKERVVREILPQLKVLGAEGIIEYPLNKVIY